MLDFRNGSDQRPSDVGVLKKEASPAFVTASSCVRSCVVERSHHWWPGPPPTRHPRHDTPHSTPPTRHPRHDTTDTRPSTRHPQHNTTTDTITDITTDTTPPTTDTADTTTDTTSPTRHRHQHHHRHHMRGSTQNPTQNTTCSAHTHHAPLITLIKYVPRETQLR